MSGEFSARLFTRADEICSFFLLFRQKQEKKREKCKSLETSQQLSARERGGAGAEGFTVKEDFRTF